MARPRITVVTIVTPPPLQGPPLMGITPPPPPPLLLNVGVNLGHIQSNNPPVVVVMPPIFPGQKYELGSIHVGRDNQGRN